MDRTKLITILAVGLLLSNMALVGFIMMGRSDKGRPQQQERPDGPPPGGPGGPGGPDRPGGRGPRNLIIARLGLTEAQVTEYDQMIQWHRTSVDAANERIMGLKNQLYATIASGDTTAKDSLVAAIGTTQQEIERIHYKHFEDMKRLCTTPEQQAAFEELTKEIASLFGPHGPRQRPPQDR